MLLKALTLLLTISYPVSASAVVCEAPKELADAGCRCFSQEERVKFAEGLTQLKTCEIALAAKDALIQDRIVQNPATVPESREWYQDPRWVVGGIVVSASIGSFLTIWALRK